MEENWMAQQKHPGRLLPHDSAGLRTSRFWGLGGFRVYRRIGRRLAVSHTPIPRQPDAAQGSSLGGSFRLALPKRRTWPFDSSSVPDARSNASRRVSIQTDTLAHLRHRLIRFTWPDCFCRRAGRRELQALSSLRTQAAPPVPTRPDAAS